ncbi:hypothetical protein [Clostridium hydrogenum]|uniref:hypothetical protein n=1 Tax=Clostridium hydrogenum TaxID=2855764 RepID=UPI001F22FD3A|nr:hypothetical protein [Clostridium hydrogenum]
MKICKNKFNLKKGKLYISLIEAAFVAAMINISDGNKFYSEKGILKFCFDFVAFFIIMYFLFGGLKRLINEINKN